MKVLIISMPRCYTKSVQTVVAQSLKPDQLMIVNQMDKAENHLAEIIHFNEATVLGYNSKNRVTNVSRNEEEAIAYYAPVLSDKDRNSVNRPVKIQENLTHYEPLFDGENFRMVPTARRNKVHVSDVLNILDVIEASNRDCVLKFFPYKMGIPLFGFSANEQDTIIQKLTRIFDVVIPLMRLDLHGMVTSAASASRFGWSNNHTTFDAVRVTPGKHEAALWSGRDREFREMCTRYKLRPIWSESLLEGNHANVLSRFGIACNTPFPNQIEYQNRSSV